jgi:hypothetical protein
MRIQDEGNVDMIGSFESVLGGYVTISQSGAEDADGNHLVIHRLDSEMECTSGQKILLSDATSYHHAVEDAEGNIYAVGINYSSGDYDGVVIRISQDGTLQWMTHLGNDDWDSLDRVVLMDDHVFVVGWTYSSGTGFKDVMYGAVAFDGTMIYEQVLSLEANTEIADLAFNDAGEPLFLINQRINGDYLYSIYAWQNESWVNLFNDYNDGSLIAVCFDFHQNKFAIGYNYSVDGSDYNWVLRLFDENQFNTFGFDQGNEFDYMFNDLIYDDVILMIGHQNQYGWGSHDIIVQQVNGEGIFVHAITFGESEDDFAGHVMRTSDGGFLVSGTTELPDHTRDGYLVKWDEHEVYGFNYTESESITQCDYILGVEHFELGSLSVQVLKDEIIFNTTLSSFSILNIVGEELLVGSYASRVNIAALPAGVYFLADKSAGRVLKFYHH